MSLLKNGLDLYANLKNAKQHIWEILTIGDGMFMAYGQIQFQPPHVVKYQIVEQKLMIKVNLIQQL